VYAWTDTLPDLNQVQQSFLYVKISCTAIQLFN